MVIIDRKKQNENEITDIVSLRKSLEKKRADALLFWKTFFLTGVVFLSSIAVIIIVGFAWFASNTRTQAGAVQVSAAGENDFSLATVGASPQGEYDHIFGLSAQLTEETIDETTYYIASANSSFRLDSDKNLNNYLANADLRPGHRGSFDLYVICRTDRRDLKLKPVFSALKSEDEEVTENAFAKAKEFLKGHILLFANMDDKGMYSGNIDFTKEITLDLSTTTATQESRAFSWGERVNPDGTPAVYRLSVYWVWPEQFGNFIYTGNSYNKNLFAEKGDDYHAFVAAMQDNETYSRFFAVPVNTERPAIGDITNPSDYSKATQYYELYSGWYNLADEAIGVNLSYIQLGFELDQSK